MSADPRSRRSAGDATARATAFVAARRAEAEELGRELGDLVQDQDAFATALRLGLEMLADPAYRAGQQLVAPGIGPVLGVRSPLLASISRGFRRATPSDRPTTLLFLADRLFREQPLELRWFALGILGRTLPTEPERTWQLLRRAAREAADWITVDTLAHPYARGILLESYRWAELEQLTFSPSRWERRLVGSTIATIPHVDRGAGRTATVVVQALALLGELIGDAEPDVQKALAWGYRTIAQVNPIATGAALREEAERAAREGDGHRAWVVRDALTKIPAEEAATLRSRVAGIRRRHTSPPTSRASQTAARFADMLAGHVPSDPPLQ